MRRDWTLIVPIGCGLLTLWLALSDRFHKPTDDLARELRELRERVLVLETAQRFVHGDISPFLKEK